LEKGALNRNPAQSEEKQGKQFSKKKAVTISGYKMGDRQQPPQQEQEQENNTAPVHKKRETAKKSIGGRYAACKSKKGSDQRVSVHARAVLTLSDAKIQTTGTRSVILPNFFFKNICTCPWERILL
jgi:hypothetical protein